MYTLLKSLYQKKFGLLEYNIAILGLEKTGKTQLYKSLKDPIYCLGLSQQYKPTCGLNTFHLKNQQINFLVWDLGGKSSLRKIWEHYYQYCHGLVYIFDSRLNEGLQCLLNVLSNADMVKIPVLVLIREKQNNDMAKGKLGFKQYPLIGIWVSDDRKKLLQYLNWLYGEVRGLDQKIKK